MPWSYPTVEPNRIIRRPIRDKDAHGVVRAPYKSMQPHMETCRLAAVGGTGSQGLSVEAQAPVSERPQLSYMSSCSQRQRSWAYSLAERHIARMMAFLRYAWLHGEHGKPAREFPPEPAVGRLAVVARLLADHRQWRGKRVAAAIYDRAPVPWAASALEPTVS